MTTMPVTRAVVLARGLGTRMRRADRIAEAALAPDQLAVADVGLKAMIPVGRPFLDYVLSGLADAGIEDVCLVIGPEHEQVRERYIEEVPPRRLRVHFAVQAEPRGTADAVLAAARFVEDRPFLVLNSDNYYPVAALRALRQAGPPSLLGFDRLGLVRGGNIDRARIAKFALLITDQDGLLRRIAEKPDEATMRTIGETAPVSMNCWCFPAEILAACRAIGPSERGGLELPHAVQHAIDVLGLSFRVVPCDAPVLDLSSRADIAAVKAALSTVEVAL